MADRAAVTPQAPAVIDPDGAAWSYRRLLDEAGAVAGRLAALGVGAESRVILVAERSPHALAALLGVLRAGAAFVPLDPSTPRARIEEVAADCAAAAVVSDLPSWRRTWPTSTCRTCVLGADPPPAARRGADRPPSGAPPDLPRLRRRAVRCGADRGSARRRRWPPPG